MTITLYAPTGADEVVEIPGGHRQVTPQRGGRYYLRAGSDERYRSISGLPWPEDHTHSTRWMAGKYVAENLGHVAATPIDEVLDVVKDGAASILNGYARRGTAVHKYIECRVKRTEPDWGYLERSGACDWLPAVDAYLSDHPPGEGLNEVTVFGESCGHRIAGTVDRVELGGAVTVIDYKSRTESNGHTRKAKEAAQLGAYAHCLLHGSYVDERGHDRTLDHIDHVAVVTFCPDGSYGIHRVELADAIAAHEARMAFVSMGVGDLYAKAERGMAPSVPDVFQAELDAMTDEDKMHLASLWREHAMPRIANLTESDYVTARRLFVQARPWFDGPEPPLPALATTEQVVDLRRRLDALPADIRKTVEGA